MEKGNPPPYSPPPGPGFVQPPYPVPLQASHQAPHQTTHVLIQTHVPLGPQSQPINCPSCHQHITTTVTTEPNTKTHLMALLLFVLGCWPCCCLPYCMDSCQSMKHNCPNCGAYIGAYQN